MYHQAEGSQRLKARSLITGLIGGGGGYRTPDPRLMSPLLYQLSYTAKLARAANGEGCINRTWACQAGLFFSQSVAGVDHGAALRSWPQYGS
jgi:hypothetical protein